MKDDLIGHVIINEKKHPFSLVGDSLNVYPIHEHETLRDDDLEELAPGVYVPKFKRGSVIEEVELMGTLVDGKNVVFKVYDNPEEIEGFLTFSVVSFYEFKSETDIPIFDTVDEKRTIKEWKHQINKIDGIIISGREIDYYLDPSRVFHHTYKAEKGSQNFTEVNISTSTSNDEDCGKFVFDGIECAISVRSIAKVQAFSKTPFNSYSEMVLSFSKEIELRRAEDIIASLRSCFQYLCRRTNIEFSNIEMYCNSDDGKRYRFGKYTTFRHKKVDETNSKAAGQIIGNSILEKKLGTLMQSFADGKMYLNQLPDSIGADRSFGPDRMIFDFAAFEREYQNLYPEIIVRSEEFVSAKESVLGVIDSLIGETTGKKKRKYVTDIRKHVAKMENGLGERMHYVIQDCDEIMAPFLIFNYKKDYQEDVENMCDRMNQLRNDFAHGNLCGDFNSNIIADYSTLECLLYAMRLKSLGMPAVKCQKAIATVMNINMHISEEISEEEKK